DFYFLKVRERYYINEFLEKAKEKMHFENEEFLFRLKSVPIALFENVNFKNKFYLNELKNNFFQFVKSIEKELI
ncbi:MAG: hypothetical protein GXO31_01730, partial [Epsilonproteobacteria bacterium]|nr:hypothetical protein [Campylobacterota bacterium]